MNPEKECNCMNAPSDEEAYLWLAPDHGELYKYVESHPHQTATEICEGLKWALAKVQKHIKEHMRVGTIKALTTGPQPRYKFVSILQVMKAQNSVYWQHLPRFHTK